VNNVLPFKAQFVLRVLSALPALPILPLTSCKPDRTNSGCYCPEENNNMSIIPTAAASGTVSLLNCADEPIHIPGSIQPHGAMLVFEGELLVGLSGNAAAMLSLKLGIGSPASALGLDIKVFNAIAECRAEMVRGETVSSMLETSICGQQFDCVVHAWRGRVIAEFECRDQKSDQVAFFALMAHGAIARLKRQSSLNGLFDTAVVQIRKITGFDRVMAYRFQPDESGEVIAEDHLPSLESFLNMRYPASDIPVQARHLYIVNTLRLIADIEYQAVPVTGRFGDLPLDMSHSVLRSVSPIHIEYLRNMGVGASMSVSIVVNGRLWGLIACHHMGRKQVPYSIRMACDVIAQVLASSVQTLEAKAYAERVQIAADVQRQVIEALLQEDDVLRVLGRHAPALRIMLAAGAVIVTQFGRQLTDGDLPADTAADIVRSLPRGTGLLEIREKRSDWPLAVQAQLGKWVGMLAWCFDPATDGWIVAMRTEQIESIRWAGKESDIRPGPLGKRLTPRGSFELWHETVHDCAEAWDSAVVHNARQLASEMHRASMNRHSELDRARTQLVAMLGHDLRDPLHTIQMAATLIKEGEHEKKLGRRIFASSSRMQRLISQIMDISRINGGLGLGLVPARTNLVELIEDIVEESNIGFPEVGLTLEAPAELFAHIDGDRIAQVLGNLISNARNHGRVAQPIRIVASGDADEVQICVINHGAEIPASVVGDMFKPFKQLSEDSMTNRRGLGLGLFITHEIMTAHRGSIRYAFQDGEITFTVTLPVEGPSSSGIPAGA
jgi:chemotaxis family two-component system sensor kinase Cph1